MTPVIPFLWRPKAAANIAFDATAGVTDLAFVTANLTANFSVPGSSGTNRLLIVEIESYTNNSDAITSVTYGGNALSRVPSGYVAQPTGNALYYYYLLNPPTGTNTLAVTVSSSRGVQGKAAFYTGVKQSGQPDAGGVTQTALTGSSSISQSVTTVANNAWAIAVIQNDQGRANNANAGTTARQSDSHGIYDSGGPVTPAGSKTLGATLSSGTGAWAMIIASFQSA